MHTGPRANYDRELRAQGIGNLLCGALGALPMTGVIVRSSANVDSGARPPKFERSGARGAANWLSAWRHLEIELQSSGNRFDMRLTGAATFLAAAIESVPLDAELHLHLEGLDSIDHACRELIATSRTLREKAGSILAVEFDELQHRFERRLAGRSTTSPTAASLSTYCTHGLGAGIYTLKQRMVCPVFGNF
jgi:hypothetical protein